jgi:hypothetical protein
VGLWSYTESSKVYRGFRRQRSRFVAVAQSRTWAISSITRRKVAHVSTTLTKLDYTSHTTRAKENKVTPSERSPASGTHVSVTQGWAVDAAIMMRRRVGRLGVGVWGP